MNSVEKEYLDLMQRATTEDFVHAKEHIGSEEVKYLFSGTFLLFKSILNNDDLPDETQKEFLNTLKSHELIYLLAKRLKYDSICNLLENTSKEEYISAIDGIREYIIKECDNLTGPVINICFKYLKLQISKDDSEKAFFECLLKEIFTIYRLSQDNNK